MEHLSPAQKAQIIGFWRQGASYEEIASIIGCRLVDVIPIIVIYKESMTE